MRKLFPLVFFFSFITAIILFSNSEKCYSADLPIIKRYYINPNNINIPYLRQEQIYSSIYDALHAWEKTGVVKFQRVEKSHEANLIIMSRWINVDLTRQDKYRCLGYFNYPYIVFNENCDAVVYSDYNGGWTAELLYNCMVHELGHALYLEHDLKNKDSVMIPRCQRNDWTKRKNIPIKDVKKVKIYMEKWINTLNKQKQIARK